MINKSERNIRLEADDKRYVWHPFTQMREYDREEQIIIDRGEGNCLFDIYGNKYIDGVSSLWTNVHGHNNKKINDAVSAQLDKIAHSTMLGLSNVPAIEYASRLISIVPRGLNKVFYSDSGSTAVEIALKIAYQYQQQADNGNPAKTKFISFTNSYHGDTIGSVSVGGIDLYHAIYRNLLFDTIKVTSPYCYRCPWKKDKSSCEKECVTDLENKIKTHHHETAALIIEPLVQGAAGMLIQPDGFLKRVRELCTEYNILMIADEVAVGFGKTGTMFACEQEEVLPDIMALAKGISGGYLPLAATLVQEKIYNGFLADYKENKTFFHGHTYTGNPLACAAAIASLDIFKEENILSELQDKISLLEMELGHLRKLSHVGDIRCKGIMTGIELVKDKATKEQYLPEERIGHRVIMEARKHGLIIRPLGDVIVLMPPLSITHDEIKQICSIIAEAIKTVTES